MANQPARTSAMSTADAQRLPFQSPVRPATGPSLFLWHGKQNLRRDALTARSTPFRAQVPTGLQQPPCRARARVNLPLSMREHVAHNLGYSRRSRCSAASEQSAPVCIFDAKEVAACEFHTERRLVDGTASLPHRWRRDGRGHPQARMVEHLAGARAELAAESAHLDQYLSELFLSHPDLVGAGSRHAVQRRLPPHSRHETSECVRTTGLRVLAGDLARDRADARACFGERDGDGGGRSAPAV